MAGGGGRVCLHPAQVAAAEAGQGVARGRREVALGATNTLGHTGLYSLQFISDRLSPPLQFASFPLLSSSTSVDFIQHRLLLFPGL